MNPVRVYNPFLFHEPQRGIVNEIFTLHITKYSFGAVLPICSNGEPRETDRWDTRTNALDVFIATPEARSMIRAPAACSSRLLSITLKFIVQNEKFSRGRLVMCIFQARKCIV
ncbi:hypothetical protein TNCV_3578211 [Trichonephila clavipes]|nr:hypothetical protein TNCV_3578211 [Trichonephila clavipes]